MAGFKLAGFLGVAPKISPELLPNTAGQIAKNCKLYSGDLLPYPQPKLVGNTGRFGVTKTLFALRDPDTGEKKWLSWGTDVDIVAASKDDKKEQRFYYTGDGPPKVSNYKLATSGSPPYPVSYYDLGLPIPEDNLQLFTTAIPYTPKTTVSYARDTSNVVTIVTATPHELRTGNRVSVSGFSYVNGTYSQSGSTTVVVTINNHGLSNGAQVTLDFTSGNAIDGTYTITNVTSNTFEITMPSAQTTSGNVRWDIRSINAANVEITKIDDTTFTYFSPGPAISTRSSSEGVVELGGLKQARSYVFTWYTPWGEESIASKPSDELFIKEGTIVTVGNIPTIKPTGNNFVRGVRLYRKLSSISGSDYYLLATLWFPTGLASVRRSSNVSRVTLLYPHNLSIGDRFKISGCSITSFDITDGVVANVIDEYTFEYDQSEADVSDTPVVTGTLYYDVSENPPVTPARYWGDGGNYSFVDDFNSLGLFNILATDDYDPPPKNLQGLTAIQNNILCGFVGNTLYFSEPGKPHAWPMKYAVNLEHNIVGIAAISGSALVLTDAYPYLISGSDPANGMATARIDVNYPCLNKNSIVTMNYGVVYSTHDGLAVYSPTSGPSIITKLLYNNDTWQIDIDPATVVAEYYGDSYFASHSSGAFVFEHDAKVGGFFVDVDRSFSASWYDSVDGIVYYTVGENGDVYEWDNLNEPVMVQKWKSKVVTTKDMVNLGAARVIADYEATTKIWNEAARSWIDETMLWNGTGGGSLVFRLWVDKKLEFETTISDREIFRLPTGYRSDTFEVEVEGGIRVRAIHLAETPFGLREV